MTPSPRELATQKIQLRQQQEKLLKDLLSVVDSLDRAAEHWQQAEQCQRRHIPSERPSTPAPWWRRWWRGLSAANPSSSASGAGEPTATAEVVASAREGIELIRESMLAVLSQHQVVPLHAKGQPFDPSQMHALGQQTDTAVPVNTVVREVVRGYLWQERVLREAQVIVAAPSPDNGPPTS